MASANYCSGGIYDTLNKTSLKNDKLILSALFLSLSLFLLFLLIFQSPKKQDVNPPKQPNKPIFLESFYKNKLDYEKAFANSTASTKKKALAGITSHHFLAKDLIANFFKGIEFEVLTPEVSEDFTSGVAPTLIIIGPDHFDFLTNKNILVATSKKPWKTPHAEMEANEQLINKLTSINGIEINDTIFLNEHSIYTLVPFAKKVFPQAQTIPLVLSQNTPEVTNLAPRGRISYYTLGKKTAKLIDFNKTLLVASIDFSHNVSLAQANKNDQLSISQLKDLSLENIDEIECDCQQCLAFLYGYLEGKEAKFELLENKTSYDFNKENIQNITSYISGYFYQPLGK